MAANVNIVTGILLSICRYWKRRNGGKLQEKLKSILIDLELGLSKVLSMRTATEGVKLINSAMSKIRALLKEIKDAK